MKTNEDNIDENSRAIKIAIDMHMRSYSVVRQIGHQAPQPAQRFTPEGFQQWLGKQLGEAAGAPVAVCYEAPFRSDPASLRLHCPRPGNSTFIGHENNGSACWVRRNDDLCNC